MIPIPFYIVRFKSINLQLLLLLQSNAAARYCETEIYLNFKTKTIEKS